MIEGSVSVETIKEMVKARGEPVIYYFVSEGPEYPILKRFAMPHGGAVDDLSEGVIFYEGDGFTRFTNYWLAYAYQCKLRNQINGKS